MKTSRAAIPHELLSGLSGKSTLGGAVPAVRWIERVRDRPPWKFQQHPKAGKYCTNYDYSCSQEPWNGFSERERAEVEGWDGGWLVGGHSLVGGRETDLPPPKDIVPGTGVEFKEGER